MTTYHVTCGYAAGVVFQMDAKHFPLFMMCTKHGLKKSEQVTITNVSVSAFHGISSL